MDSLCTIWGNDTGEISNKLWHYRLDEHAYC